ncbi:MAG: DUF3365 domain-containing protein [Desulfuromonadales bacterium]
MRRFVLLAVLGLFCFVAAPASAKESQLEDQAREATREFIQSLKGHLSEAIKEGGPSQAITVCSETAPKIASSISREKGWQVGRTSLRLRNPINMPQLWERAVLLEFGERHRKGVEGKKLEHSDLIQVDGQKIFRYMKAIPTQSLCLQCHGTNLPPAVKEELNRLYPHDQATGFSKGDIRGAFTIRIPVKDPKTDEGT